jgi:hypothetical protein
MLGELPSFYDSILEMRIIAQAEGDQVDQLRADIADQLEQRFVSTVTWDLPAWEEELGIVPPAGQPIDQRRSVVLSKMRGAGKFTGKLLKSVAESYANGEVDVRMLRKNLLPPLTDPAWIARDPGSSNPTVLGPYKLQTNPTLNFSGYHIDVTNRVKGKTVTLSIQKMTGTEARCYIAKRRNGVDTYHAIIGALGGVFNNGGRKAYSVTLESDVEWVRVYLDNGSGARGIHTFENFQLEIGNLQVTDSYTDTLNFIGKITGSRLANPHKFALFKTPALTSDLSLENASQSHYDAIATLNAGSSDTWQITAYTATLAGERAQARYSLDLIEHVTRKYGAGVFGGAITVADKVTWLKANVKTLTANWHGWGSGPRVNLLGADGNFEADPSTASLSGTSYSTEQAKIGTRSLKLVGATNAYWFKDYAVASDPAKYYVLVADIYVSQYSSGQIGWQASDLGGYNNVSRNFHSSPTVGQWFTTFFKFQGKAGGVRLNFGTNGVANLTAYTDGVCVCEVDQATYNAIGTTITAANIRASLKIELLNGAGNFETDSNGDGVGDGWATIGNFSGSERSLDSTTSRFGTKSQKIVRGTAESLGIRTLIRTEAGKYYVAVADIQATGSAVFAIGTGDAAGFVSSYAINPTGGAFSTAFIKFMGGSATHLQAWNITGTLYLDGVFVHEVDQTTYNAIGTTITAANIRSQIGIVNTATLGGWSGTNWLYYGVTHSQGNVAKLIAQTTNPTTVANVIDSNGFVHFLAYAEPSDGITASTIRTDYVELLVGLQIPKYIGSFEERKDGTIGITFISSRGIPPNLADIQSVLGDLVPAHLALEFHFTYASFGDLVDLTFGDIESLGQTFGEFERYKP